MNLNNFGPFNANTWGTVSDWAIFLVTAITGWLIWQTFKSQIRVQKMQQKLTEIEHIKFRKQFMPELEINHWLTDAGDMYETSFGLTCTKNEAFSLEITNHGGLFPDDIEVITMKELRVASHVPIIGLIKVDKTSIDTIYYNLIIIFKDANGEPYEQIVTGSLRYPNITIPKYIGSFI